MLHGELGANANPLATRLFRKNFRLSHGLRKLLEDIKRNGYEGIGKPEPLTGDLSGFWSRRIDDKNRIVYKMSGDIAEITQCGSHYRDK